MMPVIKTPTQLPSLVGAAIINYLSLHGSFCARNYLCDLFSSFSLSLLLSNTHTNVYTHTLPLNSLLCRQAHAHTLSISCIRMMKCVRISSEDQTSSLIAQSFETLD